ncbi:MAG: pullulanase-type alpha-1,6-glucosidase [Anaerolineales bacterium]|nr:pullulanase-type alpha-1,6-glucosidase [Anaerolineales bacterium]
MRRRGYWLNVVLAGLWLAALFGPAQRPAAAQTEPTMVVVPGTLQTALGCSGDWQTDCAQSALTFNEDSGLWEGTFLLPAGSYEYKIAINGTWAENYGQGNKAGGPNIPLVLAAETEVTFTYDHKTHAITDSVNNAGGAAAPPPQAKQVAIAGTLQSEAGCPGDWQPECPATALTYDAEDDVWQGAFPVQPGDDQDKQGGRYKAALDGGWAENYGVGAQRGGSDIPLTVTAATTVKFYYDHKSHWVADSVNQRIITVVGDFQTQLGCAQAGDPGCLRTWLQDPDGDGVYALVTAGLLAGTYQAQAALDEALEQVYGAPDGAPVAFTVAEDGDEIYFAFDPVNNQLLVSTTGIPKGDLSKARAYWLERDLLMWPGARPAEGEFMRLYYSPTGGLALSPEGLIGGEYLPLQVSFSGLTLAQVAQYPFLKEGYSPLKLDAAAAGRVHDLLKGQLAVAKVDADGRLLDATGIQTPGVLDDLYAYAGRLGVAWEAGAPTLRVWAPTAQAVAVRVFADSQTTDSETVPLTFDAATGVWAVTGPAAWKDQFYLYEVQVYVPATGQVETNLVTDPYSFSLSTNSRRSQIVDLDDPALKPEGWDAVEKPALAAPEDSVIYELHIRDFSAGDPSVPAELRGTYQAFTLPDSNGVQHLRSLAEAGLTHIHLLPAFDIASINEDKAAWQSPDPAALAALPGDSDQQQALIAPLRDQDGFNWGYDPYHYTTPEGSYATDPDGAGRIREFRAMVQALNGLGLRVVMDVVYNHTNASGQSEKSVLDKIVPGYYHRLNLDGQVEKSTCCENTATEHRMMEKLMVDSLLTWATAYKVDGFRFDLMGHHMLANMVTVRAALDALTPAAGGVDGQAIYIYGEGWDFGEVAQNARGVNAIQLNIGGTGIGVFNDRLRDAARGGSPFSDRREQGFLTGLFTDPSAYDQGAAAAQQAKLLNYMDLIRVGVAGNLAEYQFQAASGELLAGQQVNYNDGPAGYTQDPQENIVYVSAHDNETLFDAIQWKAPAGAAMADRVRMNNLGLSLVLLSQGVPFFHAGDDLLRSKSLDGNSYNSGDWFNTLDFTYQTNNWAVGLPSEGSDRWELMRGLLGAAALQAAPADIAAAHTHFLEMLRVRRSSPLFRLQTAEDVQQRLTFTNTGPDQIPGLLVFYLDDTLGQDLDPAALRLAVLLNAGPDAVTFTDAALAGAAFELHPVQQASADAVVRGAAFDPAAGAFTVPARTAAVFVLPQAPAAPAVVEPTSAPGPTPAPTAVPNPPASTNSWVTVGGLIVVIGGALLGAVWFARRRRA